MPVTTPTPPPPLNVIGFLWFNKKANKSCKIPHDVKFRLRPSPSEHNICTNVVSVILLIDNPFNEPQPNPPPTPVVHQFTTMLHKHWMLFKPVISTYSIIFLSNFLEHIYMYFRSSSQTKSPCGSTSGDRNGDGRQIIGGPNKDNQTVSLCMCVLPDRHHHHHHFLCVQIFFTPEPNSKHVSTDHQKRYSEKKKKIWKKINRLFPSLQMMCVFVFATVYTYKSILAL